METLIEIIAELRAENAELKLLLEREQTTSETFYNAFSRSEAELTTIKTEKNV